MDSLIEQAPHILPLAGTPQLVVLGSEVLLGGNYADLIAVDASGQLAVIEIKLAKNPEARRAVVAQILTYAAYLHGMDGTTLERDILGTHLQRRGYTSLAGAIAANHQEGAFDETAFRAGLETSLADGRFRLVLVLDQAPRNWCASQASSQAAREHRNETVRYGDKGFSALCLPIVGYKPISNVEKRLA